jgi:aminopeptidase YwaD
VGGIAGMNNDTITCEFDNGNPPANNIVSQAYTDTLDNLTHIYSGLLTKQAAAYGSDYMPFEDNGEIITGYYESNESGYVHSANDLLSHVDTSYVCEIARAAAGAALYFARAYDIYVSMPPVTANDVHLSPNPFDEDITVRNGGNNDLTLRIYNTLGQLVSTKDISGNTSTVSLGDLLPAAYFYTLYNSSGKTFQSGTLIKTKKP